VIEYAMSKEEMQELVVEAVTVNRLPLSVFEKTAISKSVAPIANKLGVSLSQRTVRSLTLEVAEKKRLELGSEFDKRLVCVKLDLCTRRGPHFLGVNVQSVINGKLKVVTASVKEMTERATAEEIKSILLACLDKIGIQERQIYSLTTDNGSNVIKVGKLMQNDAHVKEGNSEEILNDQEENSDEQVWEAAENTLDEAVNGNLRGCCGVNRMDGESNENVYGRFGMASKGEGMSCGVVEMVKCSTLRWFGHLQRIGESEMTRRIYKSRMGV